MIRQNDSPGAAMYTIGGQWDTRTQRDKDQMDESVGDRRLTDRGTMRREGVRGAQTRAAIPSARISLSPPPTLVHRRPPAVNCSQMVSLVTAFPFAPLTWFVITPKIWIIRIADLVDDPLPFFHSSVRCVSLCC